MLIFYLFFFQVSFRLTSSLKDRFSMSVSHLENLIYSFLNHVPMVKLKSRYPFLNQQEWIRRHTNCNWNLPNFLKGPYRWRIYFNLGSQKFLKYTCILAPKNVSLANRYRLLCSFCVSWAVLLSWVRVFSFWLIYSWRWKLLFIFNT